MEKKESGKLIAEFMGYKHKIIPANELYQHNNVTASKSSFDRDMFEKTEYDYFNHPQYDTDWNWLMAVVEKIEGNVDYLVNISNCTCEIYAPDEHQKDALTNQIVDVCYPEAKSKIEAVYQAVFKFIEWYNKKA